MWSIQYLGVLDARLSPGPCYWYPPHGYGLQAFLVVFINGDQPDRLGFVQTSFLGVVSWLFVLNSETPKIGYLTTLDSFTQLTFAAIFVQYLYVAFHQGFYKLLHRQRSGWHGPASFMSPSSRHALSPAGLSSPVSVQTGKPRLQTSHEEEGTGGTGMLDNPMHAVGIDMGAAEERGEDKARGERASGVLQRMCPAPCQRVGRRLTNLRYHKRVDLAFAFAIVLSYSIGVGVIIGMGVAQANAD